jgi:transcriptional regulator with XRE-family HTH domain
MKKKSHTVVATERAGMPKREHPSQISLGARIRKERKQQRLTLKQLADKVGLSVPHLSKIENGRINLSFQGVGKICEALVIPIARLLGPAEPKVVSGRRSITLRGHGLVHKSPRMEFEVLCNDFTQRRNVFWKTQVLSRSLQEFGEWSRHPGEEFILVLSGEFDLHTELYHPVRFKVGDSICFDGNMGHAYVAVGDSVPQLLICNTVDSDQVPGFTESGQTLGL